jgi:hypothetical protein
MPKALGLLHPCYICNLFQNTICFSGGICCLQTVYKNPYAPGGRRDTVQASKLNGGYNRKKTSEPPLNNNAREVPRHMVQALRRHIYKEEPTMVEMYAWLQTKLYTLRASAEDENGSELLQAAMLVGTIALLGGGLMTVMEGNAEGIGNIFVNGIKDWVSQFVGG